jgi:cyclophilin family peptidyl-prolyl cis-trans isomerase
VKKLLFALALTCLAAGGFSARAQDVINPNHSVVRFEVFTGGTNFGSIDIELFDQEKPQTVQNFLRYVYSGVYSDLVLHQLVPGIFLQGGHVRVPNVPLTNRFTTYTSGQKYAPIPNEYSVGPQFSNNFGTITMARDSSNPNSATGEWFFNLGDNASLNTDNGGFTVFGRIANTISDRTGTNLLNYFNSLSDGDGIATNVVNGSEVLFTPVNTDREPPSLVGDLFTIRSSILQRPPSVNTNHTIVRFDIITDGVFLGNIDIELFDQEKPETVRNFLLYVYSGVYYDLVLHRVEPNFVLQGGRLRIPNPFSSADFTTYTPGVNWGRITNEYSVGPELSNDYGTIAMARVGGDTNSASAEFFFNLTNNPHLNEVDGGFTVFGRVVGTGSDFTGTNMLNKFNTLTRENGIGTAFIFDYFEFLSELPVSAIHYQVSTNGTNVAPVQYRDLFTVRASVLQGNQIPDTIAPTLSVNSAGVIRTTNTTVSLNGNAGDNGGIIGVLFDGPLGRSVSRGTNNWVTDVPLAPGTNNILVRSLDYFGNVSTGVNLVVFYSVPRPLTLQIVGKGKVAGLTDGQLLEVGVNYPVTARPSKGNYFIGWRGTVSSPSPGIYFPMTENGTLIARFSQSFLGMEPGTYQGVFAPSSNGPPESTGFITFKLARNGIYSGRLNPVGASYGIRGQFNSLGQSTITGPLGTNLLALTLVWGGEGSDSYFGGYSDGHFASSVNLWKEQTFSPTNPAPAGLYTFNLSPPLSGNHDFTDGSGFGNVIVDSAGRVQITGLLADNVAFKQKTALLKGNRFPFYYSVKKGDSVIGVPAITTNGAFTSNVRWFAPGFPGGTNQNVRLDGARLTPPLQPRLFEWTTGVMTLSGGGLTEPITSDIVLEENGTISFPSNPHNIQLTATLANGLVGGTFIHPVSQALTVLKGAVLQSSNSAAGFFPGATNGGFTIRRAP